MVLSVTSPARLRQFKCGTDDAEEDLAILVERARAMDHAAWETLYRRLYPRLVAYARRRLDDDRARDAVAECFARAVAGIDRFAWRGAGFDAWVIGILRYVVIDEQRDRDRERRRRPELGPVVDDPGDALIRDEEAVAVRAALQRLSSADRELLELRVVAGLSAEDVAAVIHKRPGAVRMAQARALGRLRAELSRTL
jgi:RNA polymerase sigma-70 factor, ECF subfamily